MITIFLAMAAMAHGATYYVAESGDDQNAGTEASPFRTLQRAEEPLQAGTSAELSFDRGCPAPRAGPDGPTHGRRSIPCDVGLAALLRVRCSPTGKASESPDGPKPNPREVGNPLEKGKCAETETNQRRDPGRLGNPVYSLDQIQ